MAEFMIFLAVTSSLLWLFLGWRAVRAHERIANAVNRYVDGIAEDAANLRRDSAMQHRQFNQFVMEHPEVEGLSGKERHARFREWLKTHGDPAEA